MEQTTYDSDNNIYQHCDLTSPTASKATLLELFEEQTKELSRISSAELAQRYKAFQSMLPHPPLEIAAQLSPDVLELASSAVIDVEGRSFPLEWWKHKSSALRQTYRLMVDMLSDEQHDASITVPVVESRRFFLSSEVDGHTSKDRARLATLATLTGLPCASFDTTHFEGLTEFLEDKKEDEVTLYLIMGTETTSRRGFMDRVKSFQGKRVEPRTAKGLDDGGLFELCLLDPSKCVYSSDKWMPGTSYSCSVKTGNGECFDLKKGKPVEISYRFGAVIQDSKGKTSAADARKRIMNCGADDSSCPTAWTFPLVLNPEAPFPHNSYEESGDPVLSDQ